MHGNITGTFALFLFAFFRVFSILVKMPFEKVTISKNPPMINTAAVIFQFKRSMCLIITSTTAFKGIPRMAQSR